METFTSLEAARGAEQEREEPFVEIRRFSDTEWHAYESTGEVPPLEQT